MKRKKWVREFRPRVSIYFKSHFDWIDIKYRSLIEQREFNLLEDLTRWSNKITAIFPHVKHNVNIRPFIANDIYYTFEKHDFSQNRASAGFIFKLKESLSLDLYYLWKRIFDSKENQHVLYIAFSLKF